MFFIPLVTTFIGPASHSPGSLLTFMTQESLTIRCFSTTDPDEVYTIRVDKYYNTVKCSCIGFCTHGRCKHVKFYKSLIEGFLHGK